VTLRQRIRFYQQLAVLTRAGVPLRSALPRLEERISGREMAILIERISAGQSLGDAFAAAGFSPFEIHLVTAGERSAQLDTVLQHLSDFWARQRQMFQALTGQLYYPLLILILSFLVGALIEGLAGSWIVAMIHLVENLVGWGAAGFVVFTLIRVSWKSDAAQKFWLALPIIGRTLSTAYAYRWITALRLEHGAGIPMPDAVGDAWRASGYAGSRRFAEEGELALREGSDLSALVQHWKRLPRDWVDFIETGEISGALETAFANLEEEAGRSWELAQKRMTDWMPKIIYFFVLLVVGLQVVLLATKVLQQEITGPMNAINAALGQ
jgi:type II secretory pathway component PulF